LSTTDSHVRCLVRGGVDRLRQAARRYGLPEPESGRITVIDADLSRSVLGLDAHAMSLVSDSRAIVNCAALVSFARGYRGLRKVNVEAVRTLLGLACVGGSAFHQISTVSVGSGAELREEFLAEHPGLTDGYQRTKWVAEELLRQAGAAGLPVSCYRLGRVVPPANATAHNREDFIAHLVRAGMSLGSLPDLDVTEPWIAADIAASCVAQAVDDQKAGVWNLPGDTVRLPRVWDELRREHPGLDVLPTPQWRELLNGRADTAILKSFFEIHRQGPPREHRIHDDRFRDWLATSGSPRSRVAPSDWMRLIGS
ncbi:MAG: SDR family oxidoreductase, partial [Stackebrandtia sp.]